MRITAPVTGIVFILQSIKPRVETCHVLAHKKDKSSLYPTIHQTKGWNRHTRAKKGGKNGSLSYNPSNQGLKHPSGGHQGSIRCWSLSYNPSNQGLKRTFTWLINVSIFVFILQSIKPRVETWLCAVSFQTYCPSLYPTIHQTKGWNSYAQTINRPQNIVFILQSIKPRVETWINVKIYPYKDHVFILQSIKPRVETRKAGMRQDCCGRVFILQSIKPRVETHIVTCRKAFRWRVFILQSIKPRVETEERTQAKMNIE